MMINRSFPAAILPLAVLLILAICVSPSIPLPARRRAPGFAGQIIRANPFRSFANYMGRKLSMNVYYPTPPPQFQLQQQSQHKPLIYAPRTPEKTHYVKLPVHPHQNMAMIPPVAPQRTPQPHYQMQSPQQLLLHGISYPVLGHPNTYRQQRAQQSRVQSPAFRYRPAMVTQNTYAHQHHSQVPINVVPQTTNILVNEQRQLHNFLASSLIGESRPAGARAVTNSFGTSPPAPVKPTDKVNEVSIGLLPQQVSPNEQMQTDSFQDAGSSEDMLRIFVIRPKDMEKLKSSSESERDEMVKQYSMKFIDLEQGAKQLFLSSPGGRGQAQTTENEVDSQNQESCIEPLCDSFLRKLIPELMAFTKTRKHDDEPIVIVKNNSDITTFNEDPFVQNHKLVDLDVPQEPEDHHEGPQFTIVKAVDGMEGLNTAEILGSEQSTPKPQRVDVHFPRKKLFSAKINSTSLRKYESKTGRMTQALYQKLHGSPSFRQPASIVVSDHHVNSTSTTHSDSSSSEKSTFSETASHSLMQKPKYLEVGRYHRNGTGLNKTDLPSTARGKIYNENYDNDPIRKNATIVRYSGGVVFNNNLKVPK